MALSDTTLIITAEDTFTPWVRLAPGQRASVSLSGLATATVSLQRRLDETDAARDLEQVTADQESIYQAGAEEWVRAGVKAGQLGGDTPRVRIKVG